MTNSNAANGVATVFCNMTSSAPDASAYVSDGVLVMYFKNQCSVFVEKLECQCQFSNFYYKTRSWQNIFIRIWVRKIKGSSPGDSPHLTIKNQ